MSREYPNRPYCAVGVVVLRGDTVLLVRRGKPPRAGDLSIPGGAQKLGETVFEAAYREVLEETGLSIQILGLIDVVDSIVRDDSGRVQYHYTLCNVVARAPDGTAAAASDVTDLAWHPIDDIDRLTLWEETRRIIRKAVDIALKS